MSTDPEDGECNISKRFKRAEGVPLDAIRGIKSARADLQIAHWHNVRASTAILS